MKVTRSTFIYYLERLAPYFREFVKAMCSGLAQRGTAITNLTEGEGVVKMSVQYREESGTLAAAKVGEDIKVVYEVSVGGIVKKGLWGAITGVGISSIISGLLESDSLDRVMEIVGGAAAGAAYGMYDGFNTALEQATDFSRLLAEVLTDVENQLSRIREERAEALRRETREVEELRERLDAVLAEVVALGDELDILSVEGRDVSRARIRHQRAQQLIEEARKALDDGNLSMAKAKIASAERMVESARSVLSGVL